MQDTEYVIRGNGVFKRYFEENPINISDSITDALAANVVRGVERVMELGGNYGGVGFTAAQNGFSTWSVRVLKLPLNAPFNVEGDIVTPIFDNDALPKMSLLWTVPPDMCLILGVHISKLTNGAYKVFEQSLSAFCNQKRLYRLPLSNIYSTCKLCHGIVDIKQCRTALEVVKEATAAFDASQWNRDLYIEDRGSIRDKSRQLFRFKPVEGGMEQLPPAADWMSLSEKVANEKLLNSIVQVTL